MTITTLPASPQISDDTPTFNTKAFAFDAALATLVTEINAAIALNNITAAADVHGATPKTVIVDADELPGLNSATSFSLVKMTYGNIKTYINAGFGTGIATALAQNAGSTGAPILQGSAAAVTTLNATSSTSDVYVSTLISTAASGHSYGLRIDAGTTINDWSFLLRSKDGTEFFKVDGTGVVSATGTAIDFVTSGTVLTVGTGANNGTVSAGIFTDRTKAFVGDALTELAKITHTDGEIDHATLPAFVQVELVKPIHEDREVLRPVYESHETIKTKEIDGVSVEYIATEQVQIGEKTFIESVKVGEKTVIERDIGATISMLTVAVQQLTIRLAALEAA